MCTDYKHKNVHEEKCSRGRKKEKKKNKKKTILRIENIKDVNNDKK